MAQTFTVIHNFTGGADGAHPEGPLAINTAGILYGTTSLGGTGNGGVFKLTYKGGNWVLIPPYDFHGGSDGANPNGGVIIGSDGTLYGTTTSGGGRGSCGDNGCGTVFHLRPPASVCKTARCPWTETVLYRFGGADGANPEVGSLIFDPTGNLYGTTINGGLYGYGAVYELTPTRGGWTESILYSFTGGADGDGPWNGVVMDPAGNLYGTTLYAGDLSCTNPSGFGCGTVFQLTPSADGWIENTLYTFQGLNDGGVPSGGVILDQTGNLYGATQYGGTGNGGTVFELSPFNGSWSFTLLYPLDGIGGPPGSLVMDSAGNLYGATDEDGEGGREGGTIFELTHSGSGWTYISLHGFTGGLDGSQPEGGVVVDANGNIFGTASAGGAYGYGVVFEISP
jgi:uncharacterized repeat protein (TIGR03803 family)